MHAIAGLKASEQKLEGSEQIGLHPIPMEELKELVETSKLSTARD